ncbi:MAG: zinc ribbon domain-containing protein [Bacillota bacterium]
MIRNHHLSKSIADAGWGKFVDYLEYKCLKYGKAFVKVPPGGTSQTCICGAHVPKDLSVRVHKCPECRLSQTGTWFRQWSSCKEHAKICSISRAGSARTHACGDRVRPLRLRSMNREAPASVR